MTTPRTGIEDGSMGLGAAVSGAGHGLFLLALALGAFIGTAEAPEVPSLGEVTLISEAEFQAALATAPVVDDVVRDGIANAGGAAETPAESAEAAETPAAEDAPNIAPPISPVPNAPARPTIAEIPSPDSVARDAPVPESPPSTEPVQPLASVEGGVLDGAPAAPPRPEPEPEPAAVVEEAPPEPEIDSELETAEVSSSPDGPPSNAPRAARLPAARPAEVAAAAEASGPVEAQPADDAAPTESAEAANDAAVAGTDPDGPAAPQATAPTFAQSVTRGERDALSLGIKDYFTYSGSTADRALSVTVSIRLDRGGKIIDGPTLVRAQGGNAGAQAALFQAARRALVRAQAAGVFAKLPAAKYDAWKWIHATFTPQEGVRFST